MSETARTDRFRLVALLSIAAITALGSYWLLEVLRHGQTVSSSADKQNDPDYYVDNFHFVRITAGGQPHFIMSGKNLVHRPVTDRSDITQAQLLNFYPEQAPLTINSKQAQLDHKENTVELTGDVLIVRADSPTVQGWKMKTDAMTLLPDEDRMQTKAAVEIVNGRTVTKALGMEIDNTTGSLKLAQQVHGIFQPPPPAPAVPSKEKAAKK